MEKKWISGASGHWRDFKVQITINYITKLNRNLKPPPEMYSFIDQENWNKFVKSHNTPEFHAKSKSGKENRVKKYSSTLIILWKI